MTSEPVKTIPKKHITSACTWCRNRKVKCDGQSPSCSNCILYKQQCVYNHSDKRRLSHKKTIQALQNRVTFLESLLQKHGIKIPSDALPNLQARNLGTTDIAIENEQSDEASNRFADMPYLDVHAYNPDLDEAMQFTDSVEIPLTENERSNALPNNTTPTEIFQSSSIAPISSTNDAEQVSEAHLMVRSDKSSGVTVWNPLSNGQNSTQPRSTQSDDLASKSKTLRERSLIDHRWDHNDDDDDDDDDEIMDQLSDRIGAFQIAEDGQLRFFGATSNLHILHTGLSSLSRVFSRSVRTEGEEVLLRAGLGREISQDLERHLEDLYLRWEDPSIHVVNEEMYFLAKADYYLGRDGNPFYSETLKNAICAIGASFTSRTDLGLPSDAATFFSSKAKLLLEIEMDSPSVATVQALVIMSATEAAFTRDARGWLYSGMAVRLSTDLGLHLDLSKDGQNNSLTSSELDVRRTAFWGVFVHDNMWSLYVGRPCGISIEDVNISRPPKENDKLGSKTWTQLLETYDPQEKFRHDQTAWHDPLETCTDANIELCLMMRQLTQTIYSDKKISDEKLREIAASMRTGFDRWYHRLPSELLVNMSDENQFYLPHVLQLHMQFHALSVLLHRPFFSRSLNQQDSPSQQDPTNPRHFCIDAARSIIQLLRIYRKQYTLRRVNVHMVHLVFTASLICIYSAYSSRGSPAATDLQDLQFCCQALGEIGQAHQNATRALEVVICIKREWFSKVQNFSRFKRPNSATGLGGLGEERRKRRLTQSQENNEFRVSVEAGRQTRPTICQGGNEIPDQTDAWSYENVGEDPQASPERFLVEGFDLGSDYALIDAAIGSFPDIY